MGSESGLEDGGAVPSQPTRHEWDVQRMRGRFERPSGGHRAFSFE